MRLLFWKELMEARFIPLGLSVLFILVLVLGSSSLPNESFIPVGCLVVGLTAGCSMISSELGRGTSRFLSSLPLGKNQIWRYKLASVGVVTAFTAALIIAYSLVFYAVINDHIDTATNGPTITTDVQFVQWWFVPISMAFFGLGCSVFASTVVDRPMTAIILSAVTAAALGSVFISIGSACEWALPSSSYFPLFIYMVLDIISVILLTASYCAFCFDRDTGLMKPATIASAVSLTMLVILGLIIILCGAVLPRRTAQEANFSDSGPYSTDGRVYTREIGLDAPVTCTPQGCTGENVALNIQSNIPASETYTVVSNDPQMTASMHFPVTPFTVTSLVVIDYVPHGASGKEVSTLSLLNRSGNTVGIIDVEVDKIELRSKRTPEK